RRRRAQGRGARLNKLACAAVAPKRANRGNSVPARRNDVVLAIAPHAAILSLKSLAFENKGDQIAFILVAAIELGAVHALEITSKIEMTQNALGIHGGLCGAQKQSRPRRAKIRQGLAHAIVDDSLEQTPRRIAPAVNAERLLRIAGPAEHFREAPSQRRTDDPGQFGRGRGALSQCFERK